MKTNTSNQIKCYHRNISHLWHMDAVIQNFIDGDIVSNFMNNGQFMTSKQPMDVTKVDRLLR